MRKLSLLVLCLLASAAPAAAAAPGAQVPGFTLHRLQARFGDMAYLPTRVPTHYRYERWRTVGGKLVIDFEDSRRDDRFSFQVEKLPAQTPCDLGGAFHRIIQMDGNKVYYGGWGGEWIAWRCVTSPTTHVRYLLGVHAGTSGTLPDVALARVAASGKRFAR